MTRPKFRDALDVLVTEGVELIVVGGVAAVLGGAPVTTFDLDIVVNRSDENVARLLVALQRLDARYRDLTGRILRPESNALLGPGHQLLTTNAGPLDILGLVVGQRGYAELMPHTRELTLGTSTLRILDLPMLIQLKSELSRDKDRAVLAILQRTLEERSKL